MTEVSQEELLDLFIDWLSAERSYLCEYSRDIDRDSRKLADWAKKRASTFGLIHLIEWPWWLTELEGDGGDA